MEEHKETFDYENALNKDLSGLSLYFDESSAGGVSLLSFLDDNQRQAVRKERLASFEISDPFIFRKKAQFTAEGAFNAIKTHGIMMAKSYIKLPKKVEPDDKYWPYTLLAAQKNPSAIGTVPDLFGPVEDKPPDYKPNYHVNPFSMEFYISGYDVFAKGMAENIQHEVKQVMNELHTVSQIYYFGNGSPDGQMGRMQAVMKVADTVSEWSNLSKQLTQDEWFELMDKRLPLRTAPFPFEGPPGAVIADYREKGISITSVNTQSDAGLLWGTGGNIVTRDKVMGQDLDLANILYRSMNLLQSNPNEFWKGYEWLKLVKVKPKAEVYEQAQFDTKTRNIFVTESGAFVMAQMLFSVTYKQAPTLLDDPDSWSMLGFSPYHGGMDRFIHKFLESGNKFIGVYSDNVYICAEDEAGETWFISMDGEKMEASIKLSEVSYEAARVVRNIPKHDSQYAIYATQLYPQLVVGTVGVFGAYQIPMRFMASGTMGTGYNNSTKSIVFVHRLIQNNGGYKKFAGFRLKDGKLVGMEKAMKEAGVIFKIENKVSFTDIRKTDGQVLALDVLGFSAMEGSKLGLPGKYLPVLDRQRIMKSVAFIKTNVDARKLPSVNKLAVKFFRARMFYLLGFAYPGLTQMLLIYAGRLKREGMAASLNWKEEVAELASQLKLPDESLLGDEAVGFLMNRALPTPYEVVTLALDVKGSHEWGAKFARYVITRSKNPWNMMSLELYRRLSKEVGMEDAPEFAVVASNREGIWKEILIPFSDYIEDVVKVEPKKETDWARITDQEERKAHRDELFAQKKIKEKPSKVPEPKTVPKVTKPEVVPAHDNPMLGQFSGIPPDKRETVNEIAAVFAVQLKTKFRDFVKNASGVTVRITPQRKQQGLDAMGVLAQDLSSWFGMPILVVLQALKHDLKIKPVEGEVSNYDSWITRAMVRKMLDSPKGQALRELVQEAKALKE